MKSKTLVSTVALLNACVFSALAQSSINFYSSGSTGTDGPFFPVISGNSVSGVPVGTRFVQFTISGTPIYFIDVPLPTNGTYNFTTVTVPMNMRVRFVVNSNQLDSPPAVVLLATGDVTIAGEIAVDAKDTACAYSAVPVDIDGGADWTNRWMSGPGGFRGGITNREPGMGSYNGINSGGGLTGPYGNGYAPGGTENFCLPLVGGSGSPAVALCGSGGAGTIYLASSGRIIFDATYGATYKGIVFQFVGFDGNSDNAYGGIGMAAIFANEIVGTPRCTDLARMLISACKQQVVTAKSIYPMWARGIIGYNMPTNPLVRIAQIGTNIIPVGASQTNLFQVPSPGQYSVTIQTSNLTSGIVFTLYAHRMDITFKMTSQDTYVFPATVSIGGGLCQATAPVPINSGNQFLTVRAQSPITVAMAPTFKGSPVHQWKWEMDQNGKAQIMFATSSGVTLSHEAAMRLAVEQGKWDFVRAYGGQAIPRS
jgi:hypothetical protein